MNNTFPLSSFFELGSATPRGVLWFVTMAGIQVFIFFILLLPFYLFLVGVERKLAADVQARVGPSLSGFYGLFQPIADQIKLFTKKARNFDFPLTSLVTIVLFLFQLGSIPMTQELIFINNSVAPFLFFWFVFLLNFSLWFYGIRSRGIQEELVANRWIVQTIAGLLSAIVATFSALIGLTHFDWPAILAAQGFYPWQWNVFSSPFIFLSFFVFVLSGALATSSAFFSSAFVPLHCQKNSISLPIVRFLTFANFMIVGTTLFLGGSSLPESLRETSWANDYQVIVLILGWSIHIAKAGFILLCLYLFERVLPHLSSRQATRFGFHFLLPVSIILYAGALLWRAFA